MMNDWEEMFGIYSDVHKDIHGFRPRLNLDEYVPSIFEMEAMVRKMLSTEAELAEWEEHWEKIEAEKAEYERRMFGEDAE